MDLVINMKIVNIEEIVKKDELYSCGSPNLNKFLQENGLSYVSSYTRKKNKRVVWLYIKGSKLSELLTIWTNNKTKGGEIKGE